MNEKPCSSMSRRLSADHQHVELPAVAAGQQAGQRQDLLRLQRTEKIQHVQGAYVLAMGLTLVYTGEHYVIDVLVGWVYVGLTFALVAAFEAWWAPISRARAERAASASAAASV